MRYSIFTATLSGLFLFGIQQSAEAGNLLLARESSIRAAGRAETGDFDLVDQCTDFESFADLVDSGDSGVFGARAAANQNSVPSMNGEGFMGAYAEGSASASLLGEQHTAEAASDFDLIFEVMGGPSLAKFGGSVGVSGDASALLSLTNARTGESILAQELLPGLTAGETIDHSRLLGPGIYGLGIKASAQGDSEDSWAYYALSMNLRAPDGATPIPLPPAVWPAVAIFAAAGMRKLRSRFFRSE